MPFLLTYEKDVKRIGEWDALETFLLLKINHKPRCPCVDDDLLFGYFYQLFQQPNFSRIIQNFNKTMSQHLQKLSCILIKC